MSIRIALIDDQTLVREGIRSLLSLSDRVEVVAEGCDGSDAVPIARQDSPDVILLDIRMPKVDGIAALHALKDAGIDTPVIILTTFDDHQFVLDGIGAGAKGYLLKDVSLENLLGAIQSVHAGETMLQPALTDTLLRGLGDASEGSDDSLKPEALTPKEIEVLRLVAGGYSNREISRALCKSEGTVKNHVSNILAKMGVRDRTRAVLKALEAGLLQ
ncbi:MAG: response regulator transcription factor [Pseudomonadota bacterium]